MHQGGFESCLPAWSCVCRKLGGTGVRGRTDHWGGWYDGEDGSQGRLMGDGNEHVRMVPGGWGFREDPEGAQKVTGGEWKEESTLAFLTCPPLCSSLMGPGEGGGGGFPRVSTERTKPGTTDWLRNFTCWMRYDVACKHPR